MSRTTFSEQLIILHGNSEEVGFPNSKEFQLATHSARDGKAAVATGGNNFSSAAEFWPKAGVSNDKTPMLVDNESRWIHKPSFEELIAKIQSASVEEFVVYCLDLHSDLEGTVQPTLDATIKGNLGFNGHTRFTHQDGMLSRLLTIMDNKVLSPMEAKIAIFAVIFHDEGCGFGRSAHSLNTIGMFFLMYGEGIFHEKNMVAALGAILKHDEKVILPVINHLIEKAELYGKNQSEEQRVNRLMELLAEYASIETFLLLLLDKSDGRRKRVLNTKYENLDSEALLEDPHFMANMCWDDVKLNVVDQGGKKIFKAQYNFNIEPDDVVARVDNPKLVIQPSNKPPELKMPTEIHERFKANRKEQSYFEIISGLFTKLYDERFKLVILSAFQVFPEIDKVEIILHDPATYETKIVVPGRGATRQQRQNLDIVFSFSRETLLSALKAYEHAAKADLPVREIEEALNSIDDGEIFIPTCIKD